MDPVRRAMPCALGLVLLSQTALGFSFDGVMLQERAPVSAHRQQSDGPGLLSPRLEQTRARHARMMAKDESMLSMFGEMLRDFGKGPDPIPAPDVERAAPALLAEQKALLAGMEPAEAVQYAIDEGRKFYTFQQISGWMREQAKVEQCFAQAELSIPLCRAVVDGEVSTDGVDESLVQEARRLAGDLEKERSELLRAARARGIKL